MNWDGNCLLIVIMVIAAELTIGIMHFPCGSTTEQGKTCESFFQHGDDQLENDWGYEDENGPHLWASAFPYCGGDRQSPIAIWPNMTLNASGPYLNYIDYGTKAEHMSILNNGHTVVLRGVWRKGQVPRVVVDKHSYTFTSIHFHWGANDTVGNEHVVQGRRYAMEMNVVHVKDKSENKDIDRVLIIAVNMKASNATPASLRLHRVATELVHIRCCGMNSTMPTAFALNFIVPTVTSKYYMYHGSLTTPPCTENVTYIVFKKSFPVSTCLLPEFRELTSSNGRQLVNNFRDLQPLNDRTIKNVS